MKLFKKPSPQFPLTRFPLIMICMTVLGLFAYRAYDFSTKDIHDQVAKVGGFQSDRPISLTNVGSGSAKNVAGGEIDGQASGAQERSRQMNQNKTHSADLDMNQKGSGSGSDLEDGFDEAERSRQKILLSPAAASQPTQDSHLGEDKAPVSEWQAAKHGLSDEVLTHYFASGVPDKVIYRSATDGVQVLNNPRGPQNGDGKNLYLMEREAMIELAESREALAAGEEAGQSQLDDDVASAGSVQKSANLSARVPIRKLGRKDFHIAGFLPGFVKGRARRVPEPLNITLSMQGPDFHLAEVEERDLQSLRARVVTLGDEGELLIEISGGSLINKPGADFKIYENGFASTNPKFPDWIELAYVGISETDKAEDFRWFDCKPGTGHFFGCAGAVFTGLGGDAFDLAAVGLQKARYIKIKDIGTNKNMGLFTEGADIDSIDLLHAFSEERKH